MHARFQVKGLLSHPNNDLLIYGDILEGAIRAGMVITVPLNNALTVSEPIRGLEFIDSEDGEITYVGLHLAPNPKHLAAWDAMAIEGEVLEASDERVEG